MAKTKSGITKKPVNNEALQIALFKLYRAMNKLCTSSQLLKGAENGTLPEGKFDVQSVAGLCQEIMCEETEGLFQTFEDLTGATGVDFNYQEAEKLAEKAEAKELAPAE